MTEEPILNLKTEIEKYAVPKNSVEGTVSNTNNPIKGSGIKTFVESKIEEVKTYVLNWVGTNYFSKSESNNLYLTKNDATTNYAPKTHTHNYLTETTANEKYLSKEDASKIDINLYAHPIKTQNSIDQLINPGYYQYVGNDALFVCGSDNVHYTNGYIRVEQQSNQIIQHVYATSYSTSAQKYKIDGREYVRHVWLSENEESIANHVGKWYVKHIPWQERRDLLKNKGSTNVADNSFTIFECTAGYVFQWTQPGEEHNFTLPVAANQFTLIYSFKDLPIADPGFMMSNLIGHMDVKITKNEFKIRSTNKQGELLTGVSGSYFVPRIN